MSGAWKQQERKVASWFKTCRNPLSGRNNVDDLGARRLGDIVLRCAVVEVKRRRTIQMAMAQETQRLANKHGKPWAHFEFRTGTAGLVKITLTHEDAEFVSSKLLERWQAQARLPEQGV